MDDLGEFEAVGDEERRRRPAKAGQSWLSWVCLILFLSIAGTLLAAFAFRVLVFVFAGSGMGMYGLRASRDRLDLGFDAFLLIVGFFLAAELSWMIGSALVPDFGMTAGLIVAFLCDNLLIALGLGVAHFFRVRRERAEETQRKARAERLRLAREQMMADRGY